MITDRPSDNPMRKGVKTPGLRSFFNSSARILSTWFQGNSFNRRDVQILMINQSAARMGLFPIHDFTIQSSIRRHHRLITIHFTSASTTRQTVELIPRQHSRRVAGYSLNGTI